MGRSNTDESISSSVSMQTNYTTLPPLPPPSSDTFLSIQLAEYLDMHQDSTTTTHNTLHDTTKDTSTTPLPRLQIQPHDSPTSSPPSSSSTSSMSSSDDDATAISPLLWVPADRHPEIAPGEFTKWLETNGSTNLARRKSSLRRKSSVLSQTHIPSDDDSPTSSENPPCSITKSTSLMAIPEIKDEQKGNDTLDFDRHSPLQDTSRVLAPRGNRSLLRRSAFSARGRGRKLTTSTRRHGSDDNATLGTITSQDENTQREPVRLFDRPVSMNEWIDLGSASLPGSPGGDSQQDILSRVHDAESHILSQLSDDTNIATCHLDDLTTTPSANHSQDNQHNLSTPLPTRKETINKVPSLPELNTTNSDSDKVSSLPALNTIATTKSNIDNKLASLPVSNRTETTTKNVIDDNETPLSTVNKAATTMENEVILPTPTTRKPPGIQRASSERSHTKQERKSKTSWFGGLFGTGNTKEKRKGSLRRVEDEKCAQEKHQRRQEKPDTNIMNSPPSPTPKQTIISSPPQKDTNTTHKKSGLGSLFSRSNSKNGTSNNKRHHFQKLQQHVISGVTFLPSANTIHRKALQPPSTTMIKTDDGPLSYHSYRLPIHVERAIYRLSHYKLADPRRPLQHQVAISNLMFWYLSIINTPNLLPTHTILAPANRSPPSNLHAHFDEPAKIPDRIPRPLTSAPTHGHDDDDGDDDLPLSYYKQC